jgi:hypothetical protein
MSAITLRTGGTLLQKEQRLALLLQEDGPPVYLRFALIQQGTGDHIFPEVVLDDWGHERRSLDVYRWIYEEGSVFPRAEVFGFDRSGAEAQIFLRKIEIYFKLPCYAYRKRRAGVSDGQLLHAIFVVDPDFAGAPQKTKAPAASEWSLRHAALTWRRVGPEMPQAYGWKPLPPP